MMYVTTCFLCVWQSSKKGVPVEKVVPALEVPLRRSQSSKKGVPVEKVVPALEVPLRRSSRNK